MIDAKGGVLVRVVFPAGPSLHFFLCELARLEIRQLIAMLSYLHGIPTFAEPCLANRKEVCR
jgi:hypothetical protein